ncbi:ABC transporter ATP-binding protein [Jutongia sp.]
MDNTQMIDNIPAGDNILHIDGVTKIFKTRGNDVLAVDHVSMNIKKGEFAAFLGPSGCGKSTLLRIVSGLETSTYGSITYNGRSIAKPGTDRGMVFQSYSLYPWLNVEENIAFGLRLKGISKAERLDKAREYCELIGLKDFTKHYPIQLSGGMQQRVAIARALANDPEFLLMDEPFGALDAQTRLIMQELLLKAWEGTGKTILFVTHDVNEAVFLADKVYVMTARPGKLKYIQDIDFERPRHPDIKYDPKFLELSNILLEKIQEESYSLVRPD